MKALLLSLAGFMVSCAMAQEKPVKWKLEPIVDSVTIENISKQKFVVHVNGKQGYFVYEQMVVPAEYETVKPVEELNSVRPEWNSPYGGSPRDLWSGYYLVRRNGLYGLYHSGAELLPCKYRQIELMYGNYLRVSTGNSCAIFERLSGKLLGTPVPGCKVPEPDTREEMGSAEVEYGASTNAPWPDETLFKKGVPTQVSIEGKDYRVQDVIGSNKYLVGEYHQYGLYCSTSKKLVLPMVYYNMSADRGFILAKDSGGTVAIDTMTWKAVTPRFEFAGRSYERNTRQYFRARSGGKEGLFDSAYKLLVPFEYSYIAVGSRPGNTPKMAYCIKDSSTSYYNLIRREFITGFDCVKYAWESSPIVGKKKKSFFVYNLESGEYVKLPFKGIRTIMPEDTIVVVYNEKGKVQVFDLLRRQYVSAAYDDVYYQGLEFQDEKYLEFLGGNYGKRMALNVRDILVCKQAGKFGLMDRNGKVLLSPGYDSIRAFTDKYVDELLVDLKTYMLLYKDGGMSLYNVDSGSMLYSGITSFTKVQSKGYRTRYDYWFKTGKGWGMLNIRKDIVLEPKYDSFVLDRGLYILKDGGKFRMFALNGEVKPKYVSPAFDSIDYWENGYVLVKNNGLYGLLTDGGYVLAECIYDQVYHVTCEDRPTPDRVLVILKKGQAYGMLAYKNHIEPQFEGYRFGSNLWIWAKYNGKWGIVKL